ncbi:uncharacterized protein LOC133201056 isoform X1 [Saccostrea echinata]|uniref:uncharacterized protein LOC133201056 isoform X1 n=1 Tax=Saccostrea echinata TaxID=191078 RepID=UPI002A80E4A5|nr:uncharacterized protein LOC133201056 isoform X1 [Saccostrea echinata]
MQRPEGKISDEFEDFEELDLETPKKERKHGMKASTECYDLEPSTSKELDGKGSPLGSNVEEQPHRKIKLSPIIIENEGSDDDCKLPKMELSRSTQKEKRKRDMKASTECYDLEPSTSKELDGKGSPLGSNAEEQPQRKRKLSPIIVENEISDELPDIEVPSLSSDINTDPKSDALSKEDVPVLEDLPLMDSEVAAFCDVLEKKIKRKEMADGIALTFPDNGKMVTVVYENHGGMSFSRAFHHTDTVQSVYTFICQIIDPEILPSVFHLECISPTTCTERECIHCFELTECFEMPIDKLPSLLVLKEGNYLVDETMTFYGTVLLKKN